MGNEESCRCFSAWGEMISLFVGSIVFAHTITAVRKSAAFHVGFLPLNVRSRCSVVVGGKWAPSWVSQNVSYIVFVGLKHRNRSRMDRDSYRNSKFEILQSNPKEYQLLVTTSVTVVGNVKDYSCCVILGLQEHIPTSEMAGILSIRQVGPLITTLVGTHVAFTVASIARAGMGSPSSPTSTEPEEECFDAKHYDLMTDFVARMYGGRGIKPRKNKHGTSHSSINVVTGVKLSPTVTFEDPAAICVSEEEVREAFRALQLLYPVSLSPPICINVEPKGESIDLTFRLNQQYTLPLLSKKITLGSLLKVKVQLQQMRDVGLPESEFLVKEMKELWYGNPLMWPYPLFFVSRRLNGIVSYHLTSRLL